MESIVKELESKSFLEEDNGRKVMWGKKRDSGIPLTLVKSDGGFTYDTSDMAALKQRIDEEKADWVSIMFPVVFLERNINYNNVTLRLCYFTVDLCNGRWPVPTFPNVRELQ